VPTVFSCSCVINLFGLEFPLYSLYSVVETTMSLSSGGDKSIPPNRMSSLKLPTSRIQSIRKEWATVFSQHYKFTLSLKHIIENQPIFNLPSSDFHDNNNITGLILKVENCKMVTDNASTDNNSFALINDGGRMDLAKSLN